MSAVSRRARVRSYGVVDRLRRHTVSHQSMLSHLPLVSLQARRPPHRPMVYADELILRGGVQYGCQI